VAFVSDQQEVFADISGLDELWQLLASAGEHCDQHARFPVKVVTVAAAEATNRACRQVRMISEQVVPLVHQHDRRHHYCHSELGIKQMKAFCNVERENCLAGASDDLDRPAFASRKPRIRGLSLPWPRFQAASEFPDSTAIKRCARRLLRVFALPGFRLSGGAVLNPCK
jgi:hypothetical protein